MLEILKQPWHWSIAGILIGLTVPALYILGNKRFGLSSSLKHICAMCVPANINLFNYDYKKESWNLFFVGGIVLGAILAVNFLHDPSDIVIAEKTKNTLLQYGISDYSGLMPTDLFNFQNTFTLKGFVFFILGGFLVGFGTRYAGGCTSGHSITGLATLQWPSLVATICFMAGGFICSNVILPILFKLF